jgi:glycosyltransferase involved in cell wall biosynthesis
MPNPGADPDAPLTVVVDVSDTLASGWRAGIQRVVVQLVRHLDAAEGIRLVPVTWSRALEAHRHLTAEELDDLLAPVPPAPQASEQPGVRSALDEIRRNAGRVLRKLSHLVLLALTVVRLRRPLRELVRRVSLRTTHRDHVTLALGNAPAGSVLFDLDTVWNQTWVDRDELYRGLASGGVHVAAMVYDLLPLEHPEWFEQSLVEVFDTALTAQAAHAELVLAISRASAGSFTAWAHDRGLDPPEPVVVGLGADAVSLREGTEGAAGAALPPGVSAGRYVLVVGTVEPRKNHTVLLDAFERLAPEHDDLHLVVVGRPGWENDEVVRRLELHPLAGSRIHWFRAAGDELLGDLYDHALVVAVPSATEGFGLPVIEAFRHRTPVVASDRGALPEAGGDLAEYVDPHDAAAWADALARHARGGPDHERARAALDGYEPPAWSATAEQVARALLDRFAPR